MSLLGSWRAVGATETPHAYYFGVGGELVVSIAGPEGLQRAMLTWEQRGDRLAIDQPSDPRVDLVSFLVGSEHTLQINGVWFTRETHECLDPEAPWLALNAGASWHGIASAHPDEPFIPFLMSETAGTRTLKRIVAATPADAETQATQLLRAYVYDRAVWVQDGRITVADGSKLDAVIADWFGPGGRRIRSSTLPYRFDGKTARIAGSFIFSD